VDAEGMAHVTIGSQWVSVDLTHAIADEPVVITYADQTITRRPGWEPEESGWVVHVAALIESECADLLDEAICKLREDIWARRTQPGTHPRPYWRDPVEAREAILAAYWQQVYGDLNRALT
jgi:hypothetical protein